MADYISQFTGGEIDARLRKVSELEAEKQDALVSGENIKTVGGQSVLGPGDIPVGDENAVKFTPQTLTDAQKAQARANIDAVSLADIENMGLSNMGLVNESFTWSIFHRNYIGLDRRGIFGIILESELLFKSGTTSMWSGEGDERTKTDSRNFAVRFNYNPGIAIYVFPQVCFTVTVGIGGLYYNNIRQFDMTGVEVGRRDRTGLQFKLNIADIQIGLVAHLWNNKKK